MTKPVVAIGMAPGLRRFVLDEAAEARLEAVAHIAGDLSDAPAPEVDVLLAGWGCPPLTAERLDLLPNLRLVAYAAGTVKDFVTDAVWERGITVTTAAAANAVPVAEFTIAAIVFASKDVFLARDLYREERAALDRRAIRTSGTVGQRVGLVGASRVGRLVAERLRSFDVEVAVADPFLDEDGARLLGARLLALDELLAWSDIVSLHAPALPETRHLVGADQLARMKPGAWLINTGRGWLVDHDALASACRDGRIRAFLDTTDPEPLAPESPLWDLPGVVVTPHLAGSLGREIRRMGEMAVAEVERYAAGAAPLDPVRRADLDRIA